MSVTTAPTTSNRRQPLREQPEATDWDSYYSRPYKTASVTRKITGGLLVRMMQRFAVPNPVLAELGGANSCFFDLITKTIAPSKYYVIDNNQLGLDRFTQRIGVRENVIVTNQDIHQLDLPEPVDLTLSVGLIEHFDVEGTKNAVEAHFGILKPGGIAIMTFPTPTLLYRATRALSEKTGMWIFHDERPLELDEVVQHAQSQGRTLCTKLNWPIMLTQYVVVFEKSPA